MIVMFSERSRQRDRQTERDRQREKYRADKRKVDVGNGERNTKR